MGHNSTFQDYLQHYRHDNFDVTRRATFSQPWFSHTECKQSSFFLYFTLQVSHNYLSTFELKNLAIFFKRWKYNVNLSNQIFFWNLTLIIKEDGGGRGGESVSRMILRQTYEKLAITTEVWTHAYECPWEQDFSHQSNEGVVGLKHQVRDSSSTVRGNHQRNFIMENERPLIRSWYSNRPRCLNLCLKG